MLIHLDLLAHKTGLVIDTPAVFACDALEIVSDRDGAMKFREHLRCTEWWNLRRHCGAGLWLNHEDVAGVYNSPASPLNKLQDARTLGIFQTPVSNMNYRPKATNSPSPLNAP
jgi:hypothetical protein